MKESITKRLVRLRKVLEELKSDSYAEQYSYADFVEVSEEAKEAMSDLGKESGMYQDIEEILKSTFPSEKVHSLIEEYEGMFFYPWEKIEWNGVTIEASEDVGPSHGGEHWAELIGVSLEEFYTYFKAKGFTELPF